MSKLKPCPFCGGNARIVYSKSLTSLDFNNDYPDNGRNLYLRRDTYSVGCIGTFDCALTKQYFSEEEAIVAWNRRYKEEKEEGEANDENIRANSRTGA